VTGLIARIILSVLMLPAAAVIYFVTFLYVMEQTYYQREPAFRIAGLVVWAFVAICWFGIWWRDIRFTSKRVILMFIVLVLAVACALGMAILVNALRLLMGDFVGSMVGPLTWLILTTLVWRETTEERTARLRSINESAVICPKCGYNLTGLQGTRCPECGTLYTLDELLVGQPGKIDRDVSEA